MDRQVEVFEPLPGQIMVLTQLPRMVVQDPTQALTYFGNLLEALIVQEADRTWAYEALISGALEATDYLQMALDTLKAFGIEPEEAPRTGPRKASRVRVR
jgi:hypothetical protein